MSMLLALVSRGSSVVGRHVWCSLMLSFRLLLLDAFRTDCVRHVCGWTALSCVCLQLITLRCWINFQSAIFTIFSSLFKQLLFSFLVQEMSFDIMDFCPALHKHWQHWFGGKHRALKLCLPSDRLLLPFTYVLNHQDRINVSFSFWFMSVYYRGNICLSPGRQLF